MDNIQYNMENQSEKVDLRKWMQEQTQEYGEFVREMGEADLLEAFLMGQAAFIVSQEFQKRLEDMVDTDSVNADELVEILYQSGFIENMLTNPNGDGG